MSLAVSMGETDGLGTIDSDHTLVDAANGRGYLVYPFGGHTLSIFDDSGQFVRSIGRQGDGPGELREVAGAAFAPEGRVVVLDARRGRWVVLSETGEYVSEAPTGATGSLHRFRMSGGDAVVAGIVRLQSAVGYPLHLVDVTNGLLERRFGASATSSWSITDRYATVILLGDEEEDPKSMWWARIGRVHLEEWSLDGSHLRTVSGELPWFPPLARRPPRDGAPESALQDFAVDGKNRLWMLTLQPDRNWREAVALGGSEPVVTRENRSHYIDARLDIFDLSTEQHVGHYTWDEMNQSLVRVGDEVMVAVVEYDGQVTPQLNLYRVQ